MRAVLACVLTVALAACEAPTTHAKKPLPAVRAPQQDLGEQVSLQEAASQPGPMHKKLEPLLGDWQVTYTRIAADGTEVAGGSGITHIKPLFGGRYQRWDSEMEIGGRKQETTGWLGYDRNDQEYQLCMIMSFSSGMGVFRGQGDIGKTGIAFVLEKVDPKTGGTLRKRNRLRLVSADSFVSEDVDEDGIAHARAHYQRIKS